MHRKIKLSLIALSVCGTALLATPAAYADKYVTNNYYYDNNHHHNESYNRNRSHWRGNHPRQNRHHAPLHVVEHHYYYQAPVREPVVVHHVRKYRNPSAHNTRRYQSSTPMILGGIVGGIVGHEVGKGRGKDAATVAGVILGGSIGRDMSYRY